MKTYFKLEFKKALFSKRTIISIFIIVALLIIPFLQEVIYFNTKVQKIINPLPGLDGVDYYIRITHFSYLGFIGPLVAGCIYSTTIFKDKESGLLNKLLKIIDIKSYYTVKLWVNALVTSIVFACSHCIIVLYFLIQFGVNNVPVKDIGSGAFSNIYEVSKIAYILLTILFLVISATAFSTFIFGVTAAYENKYITYLLPVILVLLTSIFFEVWSFNTVIDFNLAKLFNLAIYYTVNEFSIFIYDLLLTALGLLLLYKYGYKRALREEAILLTQN